MQNIKEKTHSNIQIIQNILKISKTNKIRTFQALQAYQAFQAFEGIQKECWHSATHHDSQIAES